MASSLRVLPCCVMRDEPTEGPHVHVPRRATWSQGCFGDTKHNEPNVIRGGMRLRGRASTWKSASRRANSTVGSGMGGKFGAEAISERCASQVRDAWVGSSRSRNVGPDSAPLSWMQPALIVGPRRSPETLRRSSTDPSCGSWWYSLTGAVACPNPPFPRTAWYGGDGGVVATGAAARKGPWAG